MFIDHIDFILAFILMFKHLLSLIMAVIFLSCDAWLKLKAIR